MTIEQQACSFELAKRLKELGVKQESYFYWVGDVRIEKESLFIVSCENPLVVCPIKYSAFTVAELGEILPPVLQHDRSDRVSELSINRFQNLWLYSYGDFLADDRNFSDTEADARASLLIYLLEKKPISKFQMG